MKLFFNGQTRPPLLRYRSMDLEQRIRELIKNERETGVRLNVRQLADKTSVKYKRLWHFLSEKYPQSLTAAEAQAIYEALTGQSLLPEAEVSK